MCRPPKPSQRNKRAGGRANPRRGTQTSFFRNCPTKPASRGKSASQVTANGKLSNGWTKPVSSGKSASQLTAKRQLSKCPTKVPRTEKSAWEPCENGHLPNDLRKPARKRSSGWELDQNEQRWSARAKARRKEWKLTDELNREGLPTPDDEISGRPSLQPGETNILHNRGWADDLENPGLYHEEWAQEEMAAFHRFEENLRHYHCLVRKGGVTLVNLQRQLAMIRCLAKNRSSATPRCGRFLAIFAVLQRVGNFFKRLKSVTCLQIRAKNMRCETPLQVGVASWPV